MGLRMLIVPVCLLALTSCKEKKPENFEEMARRSSRKEAVMVETVRIEKETFYHELVSNGKVFAKEKVVIPFRTAGNIVELNVRNGQRVNAGELLARIEDFNYITALTRAKYRFDKAEIEYNISKFASDKRVSDSIDLNPDKERMMKFTTGLAEAELAMSEAEYNYNNTRIVSPIAGRIANLEARIHNHSGSFRTFCTIIHDDIMEVEFPVIESEYRFVSLNMPVGIIPYANDSVAITGHITEINPMVGENGMINVRATFQNNGRLIEGMNVKILIRKPVPDRLVVPKEALVMRQGRDVVFIMQDTLAIWKYVTIEFENSSSLSVSDGLAAGDMVIVSGNINLSHETTVKENAK
jgi:membrane fusion protein, multidrug efflux system